MLSAWCLGVLNSHRRFFLSYAAPVLWNVAMIGALVAFGGRQGRTDLAVTLAWASVVGAVLQFLIQLPAVLRLIPHRPVAVKLGLVVEAESGLRRHDLLQRGVGREQEGGAPLRVSQ